MKSIFKTAIVGLAAAGLALGLAFVTSPDNGARVGNILEAPAQAAGTGLFAGTPTTVFDTRSSSTAAGWTNLIGSGTKYTNYTKIDISGFREVALQFTVASTNSTSTSNVVWAVYDSVQAVAPTNAAGTSLNLELLGYVTNALNGTAAVTTLAKYGPVPRSASAAQSADQGIAGITTLYVGWVDGSTTLAGATNAQCYAFGK